MIPIIMEASVGGSTVFVSQLDDDQFQVCLRYHEEDGSQPTLVIATLMDRQETAFIFNRRVQKLTSEWERTVS